VTIRIGINGLGRIGRGFLRESLALEDLEVVAINDLGDPAILTHLLRHDSLFGRAEQEIGIEGNDLRVGERLIRCTHAPSPAQIPWGESSVDLVLESTGNFTARAAAASHLGTGPRKVIITSPAPDADLTVCYGVNEDRYDPSRHEILSNASCTTNAMAVLLSVVQREFGIERAAMTTVHCYTNNQALMDAPHRDPRRARAAGISMIPTSTSAARAIVQVMPELEGKIYALAVRGPTAAVSLIDLTVMLGRSTKLSEVRAAFREVSEKRLAGILGYSDEELVSIDFLGDSHSAVVDGPLLALDGGTLLKVFAWYDNERGYVRRLMDLVRTMARLQDGAPRSRR
jgi:glyceraldehyde 3-phosphate dehydrogenase